MPLNFMIIGAQKSATSFLHQVIRNHPNIYMPPSEVPFFEDPHYMRDSVKKLEHSLDLCVHNQQSIIGIKRPSYLHKQECPKRIRKHVPDVKLIVVLRDPIVRVISAYYHYMRMGFAPIEHINEGLVDIINKKDIVSYPRSQEIIEFSFYHRHLSHYLNYFDRRQILILLYSDIKNNSTNVFKQIFNFLDVDTGYVPPSLNIRPMASIYSIPRLQWVTMANSLRYAYSSNRTRLDYKKNISIYESGLAKTIYGVDKFILAKIFKNTKPKLSNPLREILTELYRGDALKLKTLVDSNLEHWSILQPNDISC